MGWAPLIGCHYSLVADSRFGSAYEFFIIFFLYRQSVGKSKLVERGTLTCRMVAHFRFKDTSGPMLNYMLDNGKVLTTWKLKRILSMLVIDHFGLTVLY